MHMINRAATNLNLKTMLVNRINKFDKPNEAYFFINVIRKIAYGSISAEVWHENINFSRNFLRPF